MAPGKDLSVSASASLSRKRDERTSLGAELTRASRFAPRLYEVTYSPSAGPASRFTAPLIIESHLQPLRGASIPPHRPSLNIKPLRAPPRAQHVSHWGVGAPGGLCPWAWLL